MVNVQTVVIVLALSLGSSAYFRCGKVPEWDFGICYEVGNSHNFQYCSDAGKQRADNGGWTGSNACMVDKHPCKMNALVAEDMQGNPTEYWADCAL
ncbi:hypothetical protein PTMSG1_03197 [Pyrenophora teres f. maculata]|nr:hypothetical protein PTMSG1_03197 [Pyrenophora teres f. maculata]